MTLAACQALVNDLVRDKDEVITSEQLDRAIELARLRYSTDRPRVLVEDVTGDGYRIDLPASWQLGFSVIQLAEYPIGNIPSDTIDLADVGLYQSPDGIQIELPVSVAGDVRMTFTVRHLLDSDNDTIPDDHRRAVVAWAASLLCGELANYYATESAPTINADTVDRASKSTTFAARSKAYAAQYSSDLGIVDQRQIAAGVVVDLDLADSVGGSRFYHRGARR